MRTTLYDIQLFSCELKFLPTFANDTRCIQVYDTASLSLRSEWMTLGRDYNLWCACEKKEWYTSYGRNSK